MVRVWDRIVRGTHWSVAALILFQYLNEDGARIHRYTGYMVSGLVVLRLVWSLCAPGFAHFSHWLPSPSRVIAYFRAALTGRAPRTLGLNPLGACMAMLMWILILMLGFSGWMMGWDIFWGEEWLENTHAALAWCLLCSITVHVSAVIIISIRHKENLPKAMLTGRKRPLDEQ